jgi:hypothetical protein
VAARENDQPSALRLEGSLRHTLAPRTEHVVGNQHAECSIAVLGRDARASASNIAIG